MGRLVDEDDVIDIINFECGKWTGLSKTIEKEIKALPSTQPEREKGKWIVNETLINCSVCKHSAWSRHAFDDIVRGFNFCPNCGKPMKRGEQDE